MDPDVNHSEDLTSNSHYEPLVAHRSYESTRDVFPPGFQYMPDPFAMHCEELMTNVDASLESLTKGEQRHGHVRIHHGCKKC